MATAPTTGEALSKQTSDATPPESDRSATPPENEPTHDEAPAGSGQDGPARTDRIARWARTVLQSAWADRPRLIDVLRLLGLARRAVPRPVVGPKAYPQWWQRILALAVLAALVVVIGFVLAALVGLLVVVAGFLLEQAIS